MYSDFPNFSENTENSTKSKTFIFQIFKNIFSKAQFSEYGMVYMITLQENIRKWKSQVAEIRVHSEELRIISENQRSDWIIDHEIVKGRVEKIGGLISTVQVLIGAIKRRLVAIPANADGLWTKSELQSINF